MKQAKDFQKYQHVIYKPRGFEFDATKWEIGVVTLTNDRYVFVRFGPGEISKACYPQDLY